MPPARNLSRISWKCKWGGTQAPRPLVWRLVPVFYHAVESYANDTIRSRLDQNNRLTSHSRMILSCIMGERDTNVWISCSDDLPEPGRPVWLLDDEPANPNIWIGVLLSVAYTDDGPFTTWGHCYGAYWYDGLLKRWCADPTHNDCNYTPSHWMPLPRPLEEIV